MMASGSDEPEDHLPTLSGPTPTMDHYSPNGQPLNPNVPSPTYVSLFSPEDAVPRPSLLDSIPGETHFPSTSSHPRSLQERHTRPFISENPLMMVNPLLQAEKDVDDPTAAKQRPKCPHRHNNSTPTAVSSLFAAPVSPINSRSPSFNRQYQVERSVNSECPTLPQHIYNRGLLKGRYSDINVLAFGCTYPLHRIVLDRAPFFASAFTEPWSEASAKEITLHPEDIDINITKTAFELALKRLYGCENEDEEKPEAIGLFAVGCWLEMPDLINASAEYLLERLHPRRLSPIIDLVTTNYYGRPGEKILSAAKAMLSRDGWEMPLKCWDELPSEVIRDVIGGDGFFVQGEFERWSLAKRILNRRLKMISSDLRLSDSGFVKAPHRLRTAAARPNAEDLKTSELNDVSQFLVLYAHPEIKPLLELLDHGVYYTHLTFEQLQNIRQAEDTFGVPLVPDKIISEALWKALELRQMILNTTSKDLSLGIAHGDDAESTGASFAFDGPQTRTSQQPKAKHRIHVKSGAKEMEDQFGRKNYSDHLRLFQIPTIDCNTIIGGESETISMPIQALLRHRTSGATTSGGDQTLHGLDLSYLNDSTVPRISMTNSTAYTSFPPFRFAAEFPNPRFISDRRRTYSRTVFYAGSYWNLYIQKVKSSSRSPQLGVYLHRAKDRESDEASGGIPKASVDERIGALERGILQSDRRHHSGRVHEAPLDDLFAGEIDQHPIDAGQSSDSGGDPDTTLVGSSVLPNQLEAGLSTFMTSHRRLRSRKSGHEQGQSEDDSGNFSPSDENYNAFPSQMSSNRRPERRNYSPTLPTYVDSRPTVKTYFKIYSPSKGGRMLSVYESAPDDFNFSQSWGWRSSSLMVDESAIVSSNGVMHGNRHAREDQAVSSSAATSGAPGPSAAEMGATSGDLGDADGSDVFTTKSREAKLKFMVVLGVV